MKCLIVACFAVIGLCSQVKAQAELFMGDDVASNPFMAPYEEPVFVFVSTTQEFEGAPPPAPVQKPVPVPTKPLLGHHVQAPAVCHQSTAPTYAWAYGVANGNQESVRYGLFGRPRSGGVFGGDGVFSGFRARRESRRSSGRGLFRGGC